MRPVCYAARLWLGYGVVEGCAFGELRAVIDVGCAAVFGVVVGKEGGFAEAYWGCCVWGIGGG